MLGYYICMGGFIAPCRHRGRQDDCRKDYIGGDGLIPDPSGTLYGTLTIDEVVDMAKRGYHLPFDPATIKDKSNARPIAKMMVCLEVLWMVTVVSGDLSHVHSMELTQETVYDSLYSVVSNFNFGGTHLCACRVRACDVRPLVVQANGYRPSNKNYGPQDPSITCKYTYPTITGREA